MSDDTKRDTPETHNQWLSRIGTVSPEVQAQLAAEAAFIAQCTIERVCIHEHDTEGRGSGVRMTHKPTGLTAVGDEYQGRGSGADWAADKNWRRAARKLWALVYPEGSR